MERTGRERRVSLPAMAAIAAALVYAWLASAFRPFTVPEEVAVTIPLVLGAIALLRRRPTDEDGDNAGRPGICVWRLLLVAFLAWELMSFLSSPRADHPTISSVSDSIMSTHPGRFAMFTAWLAAGYGMFRR